MLTDTVAFAENVNIEIAEAKLAFGRICFANLALDSKLLRVPDEHVMHFSRMAYVLFSSATLREQSSALGRKRKIGRFRKCARRRQARLRVAIFAPAIEYRGKPDLVFAVSQCGRQVGYIDPL